MDASINYAYPDWEITLTISPEAVREIVAKGSLEDKHQDILYAAIAHIATHCLD